MCGIAGFVGNDSSEDIIAQALGAMVHRGPDSEGVCTFSDGAFGFRRLAIVDLSPCGNQPMTNEDGRVQIVFNGEVYNFRELRRELEAKHQFRSHTDTEVLIHGYEEWGIAGLLSRIDGMFAFALWDSELKELFLARDRVGKKPLYYAELAGTSCGRGVAFASTLNVLRELLPSEPGIDPVALDAFLTYQAVPAPQTIYNGVHTVPCAHWLRWRAGEPLEVQRYWNISYAKKERRKEGDLLEELDQLLRGAVQRRLVSDVPLGAFLSGGVDSSLIVGVMSALGAGPVEAVHIGFEDPGFDERPFARKVASHWNARLHEHVMAADEVQNLPEIVWHYGQPLADISIVPTYAVGRAAREHVTVVLNGDGGDEAFAGYARPLIARAVQSYREMVPRPIQPLGRAVLQRMGKKGRMLAEGAGVSAREAFRYTRGLNSVRSDLYSPEFLQMLKSTDSNELYAHVWDSADGPTDADRALFGDLTTYLPDQLLVKMDVSTMAHSVEARSPLLDTALLEFAATIPASQMTRGYQTKYLLKKLAERYVPREVLYRRKRGFVMPASKWLRCELAPTVRSLLLSDAALQRGWFRPEMMRKMVEEHVDSRHDWGNELWTLLVLEIWCRIFIDGSLSRHEHLAVL